MKTSILRLVILASLLAGGARADDNPVFFNTGLLGTNFSHYVIANHQVKFAWKITSNCDFAQLNETGKNFKFVMKTDRWDDNWYIIPVPMNHCLVWGYYDLTEATFLWAAAKNLPNTWHVRDRNHDWKDLSNGNKGKYRSKIGNEVIDLDVFNPSQEGTVTGNDILFSFGY